MEEDDKWVNDLIEWNKTLPIRITFLNWFYSNYDTSMIRNKNKDLPEYEGFTNIDNVNENIKTEFTDEEKQILRPIAEVLAILDGNAFFSMKLEKNKEWYEMYLPEANYIFEINGGLNGVLSDASFVKKVLDAAQ